MVAQIKSNKYINELQAEYAKQKSAYKRREELVVQGAISTEDYEEYLNRYLTSKARLQQREVEGDQLNIFS